MEIRQFGFLDVCSGTSYVMDLFGNNQIDKKKISIMNIYSKLVS